MKKLAALATLLSLLSPSKVLAQTPLPSLGPIRVVPPVNRGYTDLGAFVSNILVLSFGVAILVVLFMLIWGAFEWITSGGDKEAVGKARGRIINALIGLAVLAVAFALTRVAGQFLGFDITSELPIPTPR